MIVEMIAEMIAEIIAEMIVEMIAEMTDFISSASLPLIESEIFMCSSTCSQRDSQRDG